MNHNICQLELLYFRSPLESYENLSANCSYVDRYLIAFMSETKIITIQTRNTTLRMVSVVWRKSRREELVGLAATNVDIGVMVGL